MNDSQLSAKWMQFKGSIKQTWGKLINDEETQTRGTVDILTGKVKAGVLNAKEAALHQVNDFLNKPEEKKTPDNKEIK
jgi:uncharacterized protein YjbJ (UPF0337 family)